MIQDDIPFLEDLGIIFTQFSNFKNKILFKFKHYLKFKKNVTIYMHCFQDKISRINIFAKSKLPC